MALGLLFEDCSNSLLFEFRKVERRKQVLGKLIKGNFHLVELFTLVGARLSTGGLALLLALSNDLALLNVGVRGRTGLLLAFVAAVYELPLLQAADRNLDFLLAILADDRLLRDDIGNSILDGLFDLLLVARPVIGRSVGLGFVFSEDAHEQ